MAIEKIKLSKTDDRKIRKLEEAACALKEGKEIYFSITKLTSIKSLCKNSDIAAQLAFYLSKLTLKKVNSSSCPEYTDPTDWEKYKKLISRSVSLMNEFMKDHGETNQSSLKNMLRQVQEIQNETRRGHYGSVIRTINSIDVLVIEDSICCMLYPDNVSYLAYKLAKNYAEKYNPRYGTGLISESAPLLEDILSFWKKFSTYK